MCRMAYRKAISTIRSLDRKIEKTEDVDNLPTIGKKIKEKIKEILLTGGLRKADALEVRSNERESRFSLGHRRK